MKRIAINIYRLKALLVLLFAAAVAMSLLLLAGVIAKPAKAAFPGTNGNIAFLSNRDVNNEIYSINPDGFNPTNLSNNPASDVDPAVSPDGTKIAFRSDRDGNEEIYVMSAKDGSGLTRLTTTSGSVINGQPAFSPDGTKIAFASTRDGNIEIYVMDAVDSDNDGNGDNLKRLTLNGAGDAQPSFSPSGTKIAFVSDRDLNVELYIMNADGSQQKRLTKNPAGDVTPSFSPSGKKLLFESDRDGHRQVYVMKPRPEGRKNHPRNLTNSASTDGDPTFSPDGTKIAFASARDQNAGLELYVMNADGSSQTRITTTTGDDSEADWGVIAP